MFTRITLRYGTATVAKDKLLCLQSSKRLIVIPSPTGRRRKRKVKNVSLRDLQVDEVMGLEDPEKLEYKIKQIQEYTRRLSEKLKLSSDHEKMDLPNTDVTKNVDEIFDQISSAKGIPVITKEHQLLSSASTNNTTDLSTLIRETSNIQMEQLLPTEIKKRINNDDLVMSSLFRKDKQDWNLIISELYSSKKKLKGLSLNLITFQLLPKIHNLSLESIEQLDEMLIESCSGDFATYNKRMYECLFQNLSRLTPLPSQTNDPVITKMKELMDRFDANLLPKGLKMNSYSLNYCITYVKKAKDFKSMNYFLTRFKNQYNVTPNRVNYTTIIQFYRDLNLPQQAWNIFSTMKFLSKEHSPDIITYNKMLQICMQERDYARAIDLFHEVSDMKLIPSVDTLTILIKVLAVCSGNTMESDGKQESLRLMGWKYCHELIKLGGWEENEKILSAMLTLSAYDGDVSLTRAIYFKCIMKRFFQVRNESNDNSSIVSIWKKALQASLLNRLFIGYSKFKPDKLPLSFSFDEGMELRRNILNSVDYSGRSTEGIIVPLLPIINLGNSEEILAESNAMWRFNLEFGGITNGLSDSYLENDIAKVDVDNMVHSSLNVSEFKARFFPLIAQWRQVVNQDILNPICMGSYLTIPLRLQNKNEFLARLNSFTFQQKDFDEKIESFYNSKLQITETVKKEEKQEEEKIDPSANTVELKNDDINKNQDLLKYIGSLRYKMLANGTIYEYQMKLATMTNDSTLATKTWKDRGLFRKTAYFNNLEKRERVSLDTEFARLMVEYFVGQNMYVDAMSIILSSQRHINWTYHMVKQLHHKLMEVEDQENASRLLEIVNKKKSKVALLDEQLQELAL